MTLRLTDAETEVLRRRADLERRSMQEVVRQAIREYVESHSRAELLDQVLDEELPRYAEALERLAQWRLRSNERIHGDGSCSPHFCAAAGSIRTPLVHVERVR